MLTSSYATMVWRLTGKKLTPVGSGDKATHVLNCSMPLKRQVWTEDWYIDQTDWVNVVVWGKLAEVMNDLVWSSDVVELRGTLQKEKYTDWNWIEQEKVILKVSNFNLFWKCASFLNNRNSLTLNWNISYIWESRIHKESKSLNFSMVTNENYKNREWAEVNIPHFWNVRLTSTIKAIENLEAKIKVGRWISVTWEVVFWESNGKKWSSVKIDLNWFHGVYLKKWEEVEWEVSEVKTTQTQTPKTEAKTTTETIVQEMAPWEDSSDSFDIDEWEATIPKKNDTSAQEISADDIAFD